MSNQLTPREQIRLAHAEWSQKTFGNVGPVGPLKHLAKEALEAAAEPGHLDEWADIQFLLWDAQRRAGITDDQITAAMVAKLEVNKARKWPEPKDGEPRLHIKEDAPAESEPNGILPCPFCGGMARRVTIEEVDDPCFGGDVITCLDCGASSHVEYAFKENLVSIWNNRAAPPPAHNDSQAQATLKRLAVIMTGNDSGGELAALTVTAQSLVDRCKTLAAERDTLAALPPPFPLPDVPAHVFFRVAYRWTLTPAQVKQIYQAIGSHLEIENGPGFVIDEYGIELRHPERVHDWLNELHVLSLGAHPLHTSRWDGRSAVIVITDEVTQKVIIKPVKEDVAKKLAAYPVTGWLKDRKQPLERQKISGFDWVNWNDLSRRGLLERINREIFHPIGLAVFRDPNTGQSGGALISPDGVWEYSEKPTTPRDSGIVFCRPEDDF
ncbi:DUF550 domain-containing protein [Salmonella enterica]|nr:DUF550 domain-containing protein [Salmonella enterica]